MTFVNPCLTSTNEANTPSLLNGTVTLMRDDVHENSEKEYINR
jgi:hypothetical protein